MELDVVPLARFGVSFVFFTDFLSMQHSIHRGFHIEMFALMIIVLRIVNNNNNILRIVITNELWMTHILIYQKNKNFKEDLNIWK